VVVVPREEDFPQVSTCSGQLEHAGRPCFQAQLRSQRMDVELTNFRKNLLEVRSTKHRLVCQQIQRETSQLCLLETGPGSSVDRRFCSELAPSGQSLRVSPVLPGRSGSEKNPDRFCQEIDLDNTSLAHTTMVASSADAGDKYATSDESVSCNTGRTSRPKSPPSRKRIPPFVGLGIVSHSLEMSGLSKDASKTFMQSWASGTQKHYNSALQKWNGWCSQQKINPLRGTEIDIMNFLEYLKSQEYKFSTISSAKSAILNLLMSVNSVFSLKLLPRYMKGLFKTIPPKPRYLKTWDVSIVVDYLSTLHVDVTNFHTSPETKKLMTLKTVTLLLLSSPQRASEISMMRIDSMKCFDTHIIFELDGMTKTRRNGPPLQIKICRFTNKNLCPVEHILKYIKCTESIRGPVGNLFLSLSLPSKPVTATTIARWVKTVLLLAGIPTQFKPHSIRSAATSKAFKSGISLHEILKHANWSCKSNTFQKFYNRDTTVSNNFTVAVLDKSKQLALNMHN